MFGRLRCAALHRPDQAFGAADAEAWHYTGKPDLASAQREHDALGQILDDCGVELWQMELAENQSADAIFVQDPCWITDQGVVQLRMGKRLRESEPEPLTRELVQRGVPLLAALSGAAVAEGGDLLWLEPQRLIVGQGYRTNPLGLDQLRDGLAPCDIEITGVDLPHHQGPEACLHLTSLISIVDRDIAVIFAPLLPVAMWRLLQERGFRLVEVPESEFDSLGTNVLAVAPSECVVVEGNPLTRQRLERLGCRVHAYPGQQISLLAEGGPTCLVRPVLRDTTP